jgi:glycosyltransferase involved in cell wall biosynthesis
MAAASRTRSAQCPVRGPHDYRESSIIPAGSARQRTARKSMASGTLQRIDNRPFGDAPDEIRAFLTVRNEALRLPSTLRHCRELGVHRFFVVDNGSTDGTLELLSREKNVHVFTIADSYAGSHWGVDWMNTMLDAFGDGHWTLTIDADEQFIYPHYEELKLPRFCRHLDAVKAEAVFCLLIDMYSNQPVSETVHIPSAALLDTCRYFDAGEYRAVATPHCPYYEVYGGARERIFRALGTEFHAPTISKVPLVRWRKGTRFLHSTHILSKVATANVIGALLHFKFLSDFHDRVEAEVVRGEHYDSAREYRAYRDLMRKKGTVNFMTDKSVRFVDSAQLVRLGLMRTDDAFEQSLCVA